ncbi:MAG: GNAT family N-acetyltransferase [Pseudonocardiaceae bacterium]
MTSLAPAPAVDAPWQVRPAEPHGADLDRVVRWMAQPHIEDFWQQAWSADRWAKEITTQRAGEHSLPCLVFQGGTAVAYLEIYRARQDRISALYPTEEHDLGVHVAIGEAGNTGRGLGRSLLRAIGEGLFAADPACRRVVAEPDVRNVASLRAFAAAGFRRCGELTLPEKTAALLVRPRAEQDLPRWRVDR